MLVFEQGRSVNSVSCSSYSSSDKEPKPRSRAKVLEVLEGTDTASTIAAYRRCEPRSRCRRYRLCDDCAARKADELFRQVGPQIDGLPEVRGYMPQALTITRQTLPADREDPLRYRERVRDTFDILRRSLQSGFLHHPGCGAIVVLHLQSNINFHGVYFGPRIPQVSDHWLDATRDSDRATLEPLKAEADLHRWLIYMRKISSDITSEELVFRWNALKGVQTMRRYGVLHGLSKGGQQ